MKPLTLLLAGMLVGCEPVDGDKDGSGGDGEESTDTLGDLTTVRYSDSTDGSGLVAIDVDVSDGDGSFMISADGNDWLALEAIYAPNGDTVLHWSDWYESAESLTAAIFPEARDAVAVWPVRGADAQLSAGTWTVEFGAVDDNYNYVGNSDMDITVQTKADSSFSSGTVTALVVYADGLGSDSEVVSGTEAGVDRWKDIWAAIGIDLQVSYVNGNIDADLPFPDGTGGADIASESDNGTDADVTVIIGEVVDGDYDLFGVSGGIPGTLISSGRSAVVLSWVTNAGADGSFDSEDIRLYGETLAHEVGHYAGLFHPVEDGWEYWDAIDDTSHCSSWDGCENDLGDNLMFPYPVCDWDECVSQDQLSDGQAGVAHRYTGTL